MAAAAAVASSSYSNKRKQPIISISSSSSEDEEEDDDDDDDNESENEEEPYDFGSGSKFEPESGEDDEQDQISEDASRSSNSDDDDDYADVDDNGDGDCDDTDDGGGGDGESKGKLTDEEHCNKVIDLLQRRESLNLLKLEECKAYLRKHELRISGTKSSCVDRILEHWRIKDGTAEKLYPASSFVINCTGDVCRGDVVLFKQRVYEKFDLVKRGGGGKITGKRIVVGRIVNESYGGSKQQHTFSVDVLWSKGVKPLPLLFPLLVKGRNLYRMKTFRQPWTNEAMRLEILDEKHKRGAAARHVRAIARAMASSKGRKRKRNSSTTRAAPNKQTKKESKLATKKKKQKQQTRKESKLASKKKQKFASPPNRTPPSKQRRKDSKLATKEKKQKCAAQPKQAPRNNLVKKEVDLATKHRIQNFAGEPFTGNREINTRELESTRNSESYHHEEQFRHVANRYPRENPYPQRFSYCDYNHPPVESFHRSNMGIPQTHQAHYAPSYHMGNNTSYSMSYSSSQARPPHGSIWCGTSYVSYPYGHPSFQQDPRRQVADRRFSAGQFHGWQRP